MTKTVPAHLDGFTPLLDELVAEYGLVTAAIYGRVWRYCQMKDGVCKASLETMGRNLALNRSTVFRHIRRLVSDGYLIDRTPDLKRKLHVYADAGRAKLNISVRASVAQNNRSSKTVAHDNKTVAESATKIVKKKVERAERPRADLYPLASALAEVCRMNLAANTGQLFREAKMLANASPAPTPEAIREHYSPGSSWYSVDWRGKRGDPPGPAAVRQTWGRWNGANPPANDVEADYAALNGGRENEPA